MKPAGAFFTENLLPINIAGFQLRHGGVSTIRTTDSAAHAKSALSEIQSIPHGSSDAVVRDPANMRLIDAALVNQILHQSAHRIIRERSHHRGIHPKTSLQAARDVVFAA